MRATIAENSVLETHSGNERRVRPERRAFVPHPRRKKKCAKNRRERVLASERHHATQARDSADWRSELVLSRVVGEPELGHGRGLGGTHAGRGTGVTIIEAARSEERLTGSQANGQLHHPSYTPSAEGNDSQQQQKPDPIVQGTHATVDEPNGHPSPIGTYWAVASSRPYRHICVPADRRRYCW